MIPELATAANVVLVEPPDKGSGSPERLGIAPRLRRHPADQAPPAGRVELLHLGNNPYHLWVAQRLRSFGGVVVLHDSVLHHLLVEEAAGSDDWARFSAEMSDAYGRAGAALARARQWGFVGRLDPFLFPARRTLLRHASAVIVHNELAAAQVVEVCPGMPVRRVPLGVAPLPEADRAAWRRRLGVGRGELLLVHLGFLTPEKGLDVVLRALVALGELAVRVRLVLAGEAPAGSDFPDQVRRAGLADRVKVWGWASQTDLGGIVAAADLGLVPRYPTAGESSAAALRFMAAGTPVAISGYGQFLELPPAAAFRIPPGRAGVAELVRVVASLSESRGGRVDSRAAARRCWADGGHSPRVAARSLLAAVQEMTGRVAG
jgi:glycosyltransferase involved in cell wall biosynthesis